MLKLKTLVVMSLNLLCQCAPDSRTLTLKVQFYLYGHVLAQNFPEFGLK